MKARRFLLVPCLLLLANIAHGEGGTFEEWMKKGSLALKKRQYQKALQAYKEAVKADPLQMDAYFNVGSVAQALKKCEDVLIYFRGFLYLSPGTEDDKTARAAIRECEGRPEVGRVTIESEPSGAEVKVNGALVGRTPLEIGLFRGTYKLGFYHPDCFDTFSEINVTPKEPVTLKQDLPKRPAFGFLEVSTEPKEGVTVFVDEQEVGVTPLAEPIKLEAKKVLVRLRKEGYDDFIRAVTILRDKTYRLDVKLEKASPEASPER